MTVICCPGNATMGLYAAWDGIVDVSPREDTAEYRRYERDEMKKDQAPMHKVARFVSDKPVKW